MLKTHKKNKNKENKNRNNKISFSLQKKKKKNNKISLQDVYYISMYSVVYFTVSVQ